MRLLVAALSIFLLAAFCLMVSIKQESLIPCCNSFVSHRIPDSIVIGYVRTSILCPKPGVVFETKRGVKVCANPTDKWVKKYVKNLGSS